MLKFSHRFQTLYDGSVTVRKNVKDVATLRSISFLFFLIIGVIISKMIRHYVISEDSLQSYL